MRAVEAVRANAQQTVFSFVPHTPQAFDEVRREAYAAKYGHRDSQMALPRAIDEAWELV